MVCVHFSHKYDGVWWKVFHFEQCVYISTVNTMEYRGKCFISNSVWMFSAIENSGTWWKDFLGINQQWLFCFRQLTVWRSQDAHIVQCVVKSFNHHE